MEGPNLSAPKPRRTTAIFSKRPVPGMVKTRLCPPLRPAQAAELAEAMLLDVTRRFCGSEAFHTALYFSPEGARGWYRETFPALADLRPQVGQDLAKRLAHYFVEELLGTVGSTAVAVGSDAPLVTTEDVARAHDLLAEGADLVLGPDAGGGYYLVGMREPRVEVFDVRMSTGEMFEQTLEIARKRGMRVETIDEGYDIDVGSDLERLRADLAAMGADDPRFPRHTAECVAGLAEAGSVTEHDVQPGFVRFAYPRLDADEMRARARAFRAAIETRRSVRFFSPDPVPLDVLDECIEAASTAPSGAHRQPWTFAVVTDPQTKREIRLAAEQEERETYDHRLTEEWRAALEPLGTNWEKPFLEIAPALIVVFRQSYGIGPEGERVTHYYTQESVGIASGFLLAALHAAGLATLTHTPSPMGFLGEILGRPENERAYLLIPVGFPAADCIVPDLVRKPLDEVRIQR